MGPTAVSAALDIVEHADLVAARRVVSQESRALARLSQALTERFVDATEILASTQGRIVVSGMGKSGHIANKMAATFASTGAPSLFVHPAEASHGDLGMITDADTLLMLSNSGETPELADLVNYGKRFRIPLVAIVGRAPSTLAEAATVALVLPDEPEAGTLGLAPTTSTIMMLALGDALAVALLERKGLTADDFKIYHPGGKLGRRLVRVADIMHAGDDLPLVPADTAMAEALIVMTAKRLGCVGAVDDDGALAGIVTDGDLRRHMDAHLLQRPVADVMTTDPITIHAGALGVEAVHLMNRCQITSLFVIEEQRPVGVVHVHDCLRAGLA
ncbi:MAG: KpsF/GutQ family sugar-phosphate isomerase [Rhodospirillales bacterium]|nr:KpsF/GutQ family sugar-phosphate isomerase [Rhodospirillales bacterium]MDE0379876.1 KpsF/GutQ family sugar-phosphate isomerase [Rhodospirillales bacterium]